MLIVLSLLPFPSVQKVHLDQSMDTTPYDAIQLRRMPPHRTQFNEKRVACHIIECAVPRNITSRHIMPSNATHCILKASWSEVFEGLHKYYARPVVWKDTLSDMLLRWTNSLTDTETRID